MAYYPGFQDSVFDLAANGKVFLALLLLVRALKKPTFLPGDAEVRLLCHRLIIRVLESESLREPLFSPLSPFYR